MGRSPAPRVSMRELGCPSADTSKRRRGLDVRPFWQLRLGISPDQVRGRRCRNDMPYVHAPWSSRHGSPESRRQGWGLAALGWASTGITDSAGQPSRADEPETFHVTSNRSFRVEELFRRGGCVTGIRSVANRLHFGAGMRRRLGTRAQGHTGSTRQDSGAGRRVDMQRHQSLWRKLDTGYWFHPVVFASMRGVLQRGVKGL